jgi:hypothetical protein
MSTVSQAGVALMALGSVFALVNWLALEETWRTGRFHSVIPPLGGLCLAIGALLVEATRPWAWLAVVVDPGTFLFVLALPSLVAEAWTTSRFTLLEEYEGQQGNKTVLLRLFRNNHLTLRQDFHYEAGKLGTIQVITVGTWERNEEKLVVNFWQVRAVLIPLPPNGPEVWRQADSSGEDSRDLSCRLPGSIFTCDFAGGSEGHFPGRLV